MNPVAVVIWVLVIAGFLRGVDEAELPGLYSFAIGSLKQEITIGADGKYVNALYREGKLAWSD